MATRIRNVDLAAVRAVLDGSVDLAEAARSYSVPQSAITAVAILHAVGKTTFTRGTYRGSLQMLMLYPAVPIHGLPKDRSGNTIRPEWYVQKCTRMLVVNARALGLHVTENHGTTVLTRQPQLASLIQQRGFRKKARELYEAASARRETQLSFEEGPNRQYNLLMSALKNPSVTSVLRVDPDASVEEIHSALGAASEILNAYFPKQR